MANEKAVDILLVEDNEGDVLLTEEALQESKINNKMFVVRDGEEAMDFLLQRGQFKEAPRPDLILLDLNIPRKDGREVLKEIKEHDHIKSIPVVILTTSDAEKDIVHSYKLHANCYIKKPVDFEQFAQVVEAIEDFWFTIVKLPDGRKEA